MKIRARQVTNQIVFDKLGKVFICPLQDFSMRVPVLRIIIQVENRPELLDDFFEKIKILANNPQYKFWSKTFWLKIEMFVNNIMFRQTSKFGPKNQKAR